MKGAPLTARALAVSVLARVEATDAYLNVVLDQALDEAQLKDPRDAGLVTELVYGVTRRRLTLDFALKPVVDRALTSLEDRVLAALRLGAYQRFFTRVPPHAAVSDTVEALKTLGLARAAGFANAVLRKVSALPELPLPPAEDVFLRLSIEHSHPRWLVERWCRQLGPERATELLQADNQPAPLCLRANTTLRTRDELVAELVAAGLKARPTSLSSSGLVVEEPGKVEDLLGYAEGWWQVQDEAAQLVGEYAQVPAGARVWDVCAAPGGKSCHLAQTCTVLATDVHAAKLSRIDGEARRLGVKERLSTRQHDATRPAPRELGDFDAVLVDAPCTGLGTLRRHPELRYRRSLEDFGTLTALQRSILSHVQEQVKPGGLLVYSVCSMDPSEGQDQVDLFLRSHPDFTAEPPRGLGHLPTAQGHLRTLPGPQGFDGFFCARLRRMY